MSHFVDDGHACWTSHTSVSPGAQLTMITGSIPCPRSTYCRSRTGPSSVSLSFSSLPPCRRLPRLATSCFRAISSWIASSLRDTPVFSAFSAIVHVLERPLCRAPIKVGRHVGSCKSWCDPPGVMANGLWAEVYWSLYEPRPPMWGLSCDSDVRPVSIGVERVLAGRSFLGIMIS